MLQTNQEKTKSGEAPKDQQEAAHSQVDGANPATNAAEGEAKPGDAPKESPPPPEVTPNEKMALGPLPSMGIPDELFLADKSEADQCLITITGAYIRVRRFRSVPPVAHSGIPRE